MRALKHDAAALISRYYPDAEGLFAQRGWKLPTSISRVYDPSHAQIELGFRCRTDFGTVVSALRDNQPMPFAHDPDWFTGTPYDAL